MATINQQKLQNGALELGLLLSDKQISQLLKYLELLLKWNKAYSLTAITAVDKMLTHHLLDGLTVIKYVNSFKNIIDVGSGMGVPGVIIAICCPEIMVTAIDCNSKKTAFLLQVAIELSLSNLTIVNLPVEDFKPEQKFDLAISRAFARSTLFVNLVRHLFAEKVTVFAMKAQNVFAEVAEIQELGKYECEVLPLVIPGVADERYLLKIYSSSPSPGRL